MDSSEIQQLKRDLLYQVAALKQQALLPAEKGELDAVVQQLELLNPTRLPLSPVNRSLLLGRWKLIYASNGTVVTRQLAGGISINEIWQILNIFQEETIAVTNGMELELPLLGKLQMQAQGLWQQQDNMQTARVTFDAFSLQATGLFHQPNWQFPALHIPILEWMRREASWQTTYLDSELRIGQGVTGNRFVFMRQISC
ncbi:PAP/fibrillin family protein [Pantanalinema sp. GBBB05]|uniref:PAP/fibrillin family protein n=1 Tax=Pantanalinema sp. GBBB05 TaxID=2604139 RepID=UPI001D2B14EB|nr:PAP fibrillin [Pantanalinema sp. GBBB05]